MRNFAIAFVSLFVTAALFAAPTAPVFATSTLHDTCAQTQSHATGPTVVDGQLSMTVTAKAC